MRHVHKAALGYSLVPTLHVTPILILILVPYQPLTLLVVKHLTCCIYAEHSAP